MSKSMPFSREKKLEHYSNIRKTAGQKHEWSRSEVDHLFSDLHTDLISEDKFVLYECQKAYTAILKNLKLENGTHLVIDILEDCTKVGIHPRCLEMCTELLSQHCQHCLFYSEQLHKPLLNFCKNIFLSDRYQTALHVKDQNSQCLYCLFKIFYKLVKLIRIHACPHAMKFIQSILHDFNNVFVVLINSELQEYVRRRLIRFVCSILKCDIFKINDDLSTEVINLNDLLIDHLGKVDFREIFSLSGECGFTGREGIVDPEIEQINITHIRGWSLLTIFSVALKSNKDEHVAMKLIDGLDFAVKLKLGRDCEVLLSWLPDVFSDQDDVWIEILQTLITMSSNRSKTEEVSLSRIESHWYFLQFNSYTGFDHVILIDFLTSPETNFLQYLISYLKFLLASWQQFKDTVTVFQQSLDKSFSDVRSLRLSEMPDDVESADYKTGFEINSTNQTSSDRNEQTKGKHTLIDSSQSKHSNLSLKNEMCLISREIHSNGTNVTSERKPNYLESECCEELLKQDKTKKLSGLGMISEMYSDSEDSCDGDDMPIAAKTAVDVFSCQKVNSTILSNGLPNGTVPLKSHLKETVDTVTSIQKLQPFCNETTLNVIDKNRAMEKGSYSDKNVYAEDELDKSFSNKSGNFHKSVDSKNGDGDSDCEDVDDNGDDDDDGDYDKSDSDCEDVDDDDILCKTMSMLIRVRLKLERLWESDMINYNPRPLVVFLEQVEYLYENLEDSQSGN